MKSVKDFFCMFIIKDIIEKIDDFWALSWFELHLLIARYNDRQERRRMEIDLTIYNPLRILWSTIMNRHRGKSEKVYKPSDLLPIPMIDGEIKKESVKTTDIKKVIQKLGKQFARLN